MKKGIKIRDFSMFMSGFLVGGVVTSALRGDTSGSLTLLFLAGVNLYCGLQND